MRRLVAAFLVVSCGTSGAAPMAVFQPNDSGPSDASAAPIDAADAQGAIDPGCSDKTREAFTDRVLHPNIAGCAGGFSVPGTVTAASLVPSCERGAGNDSPRPNGDGCSIEDLCAEGWHVCKSSSDLQQSSGTQVCDVGAVAGEPQFWLTRQSMILDECAPSGHNNLVGCGSGVLGAAAPSGTCAPLDRQLRYSDCTMPWSCAGPDGGIMDQEADLVTKSGPKGGGVLCCRGPG